MNKELIEALNVLEKENNISKDILLEAIENSLLTACKNHFGKADNVKVNINRETGDFAVYAEKEVAEDVEDPMLQISLAEAKMKSARYDLGDIVHVPINSKEFGRIATQNAKNVILQKIREEERKALGLAEEGHWLKLVFAHVKNCFLLYSDLGKDSGFTLEDGQGEVEIRKVRANRQDKNAMYLHVSRKPEEDARLSFAWQADPVRLPMVDEVTYLPPLSFYRRPLG